MTLNMMKPLDMHVSDSFGYPHMKSWLKRDKNMDVNTC